MAISAELRTQHSEHQDTERDLQPGAGIADRTLIDTFKQECGVGHPQSQDSASWTKHVGGCACIADAMCWQSESHIRVTSCCPGGAADILTLTVSHVGLIEPRIALLAVLKGQAVLIHIHVCLSNVLEIW